jgi:Methyltransferase domain
MWNTIMMPRNQRLRKTILLAIILIVICTSYFKLSSVKTSKRDNTNSLQQPSAPESFAFVNNGNRTGSICDHLLFVNTPVAEFKLSNEYQTLKPLFDSVTQEAGFVEAGDGHSGRVPLETLALHYFASRPSVHTVCETGFNAGHSTFNFLTANRRLVVHSFDISSHGYSKPIADKLSSMFPDRFFYHIGDSRQTVPQFIAANPQVTCSIINIDGGHTTPVAFADVTNFASVADLKNGAVIVFDDYPSPAHSAAWDRAKLLGYIEEVASCLFPPRGPLAFAPGFAFGSVIRRPNITHV